MASSSVSRRRMIAVFFLLMCMGAVSLYAQQTPVAGSGTTASGAGASGVAATATATATATLKGKVPIFAVKPPAVKSYGTKPSIKVEPPEPATSAIWVGSGAPPLDPKVAPIVRIVQKGFQFRPALAVVEAGTPVVFPNEDSMYHSVFSYSEPKKFDLGRYRKGEEPDAIVFDKPGTIELYCEVHAHMRANIIVVDTPWFACSDPSGQFQISGIAPGKHKVNIWLSPDLRFQKDIELSAGQTLEVDWSKDAPAAP